MRRSARLLATIAALSALTGCLKAPTGAPAAARPPAPLTARATPAPVEVAGLSIVILDDEWTRFRLDIFDEAFEEPAADCTFEAVFEIDPATNAGFLKVTKVESVTQRGKTILRRDGQALPVFDRKRVLALADDVGRFSLEAGFPSGLAVTKHLRALVAGETPGRPSAGAITGRPPAGVSFQLRAGRTGR